MTVQQLTPLIWWLLVLHALCDYPLQGDFLARGKNHKNPIPGVPFWHCLVAHSLIHAGAVALITGRVSLGLCELVAHLAIDYAKCDGRFDFDVDQFLHVVCKLIWAAMLLR